MTKHFYIYSIFKIAFAYNRSDVFTFVFIQSSEVRLYENFSSHSSHYLAAGDSAPLLTDKAFASLIRLLLTNIPSAILVSRSWETYFEKDS